ncbi:Uncharacterised protein [Mycobacteroides abscessus subsp. abscessus]|nr:Uncharacterised protein [Mycobacteroides abscessus subsp. abscessus]
MSAARQPGPSTIRQPNAAVTNSAMKMSSIPMREDTYSRPSAIIRMPAIAPISVERVILRTIRMTSSTSNVPASAAVNRHPQPL